MWWLVPVGVVGVTAAIYGYFTVKEREAAERWERDRERVQRTIEEHRRNIESNIAAAELSYNYKFLLDLHHSSFRIADEAYRLKTDASTTLTTMGRMLDDAKVRHDELRSRLRAPLSASEKEATWAEIQMLKDLRSSVRVQFQKVLEEKRGFFAELSRLNEQTRSLKVAIRDRCGTRGREWYDRMEARKLARR